jgi:hypothetical protein
MMKRYLKPLYRGLKYAGILFTGTSIAALGYLQYVNSQVGPIDINKEVFIDHYMKEAKLDEK